MKKIFLIIIILLNANIVYSQEDTLNANWKLVDGGVTDYMQRGYIITQIYSFGANEHVYHMRTKEEDTTMQKPRLICIIRLTNTEGSTKCYMEEVVE